MGHGGEALAGVARGPPDFDVHGTGGLAEPDVLPKGRRAERPAAANGAVDASASIGVGDFHVNSRADGRAVGLDADQLDVDPVVAVARVLEQPERMGIAGGRPAHVEDDVVVAVVVHIGERDAVALVELAGSGGAGHIHERLAVAIAQQHARSQRPVGGIARPKIDVQKAIVVDVAEVGPHRHVDLVQPGLTRHVQETAVAAVLVQLQRGGVVGQLQVRPRRFFDRREVAGGKDVRPAVVVVVEEPGGKALPRPRDPGLLGDVGKGAVVVVVEQRVGATEVRHVEFRPAVVVDVSGRHALGVTGPVDAGARRDVLERAVALVQEQLGGAVLVADKQVHEPVVVDIGPHRRLRAGGRPGQAARLCDVGERAVAVVAQQRLALGDHPRAAQGEDVEAAVVVVVGLHDVQPAELCGQAVGRREIDEPARGVAPEVVHRTAAVAVGRHQLVSTVAVEVVDDDAAGRAHQVKARLGRDVRKAPHVLGRSKRLGGNPESRGHRGRVSPGRHVRQVEEPPDFEFFRVAPEIGREVLDGPLRVARVGPCRQALRRQQTAVARLVLHAVGGSGPVKVQNPQRLFQLRDGRGDTGDGNLTRLLEMSNRVAHLSLEGEQLAEQMVALHDVQRLPSRAKLAGRRQRALHGRDGIGHRILARLTDGARILIPVVRLREGLQRRDHLAQSVDAQHVLHAACRNDPLVQLPRSRRAHWPLGDVRNDHEDGKPRGNPSDRTDCARNQPIERGAQFGTESGDVHSTKQASAGGRRIGRQRPGQHREVRAVGKQARDTLRLVRGSHHDDADGRVMARASLRKPGDKSDQDRVRRQRQTSGSPRGRRFGRGRGLNECRTACAAGQRTKCISSIEPSRPVSGRAGCVRCA